MDKHTILGTERIGKLVFKFSIPAVTGMVVSAFYNVVDRIFVGRGVGSDALSGVTVTMPFMLILFAFMMLIGVGAAVRLSISLGEKKIEEAGTIIGNSFLLSVIAGIILPVVCFFFMRPLLVFFGGSGRSLIYAEQFMEVILFSILFQSVGFVLTNTIRAKGSPMTALYIMVSGAAVNTILNPIFIFILHMGIRGSAFATLLASLTTAVWTFLYFIRKENFLRLRIKNMHFDSRVILGILSAGSGPSALQIAICVLLIVMNNVFSRLGGSDALAIIGIISVVNIFFSMVVTGISQGCQPIIGYNYGAKQIGRAKQTVEYALIASSAFCFFGFLPIFFFSREIISLFSTGNSYISNMGPPALKYSQCMIIFLGLQIIGTTYYNAVGRNLEALFLFLLRQVLIIVPVLLILSSAFGFYGAVAAFPVSDAAVSIIIAILLGFEWRKLGMARFTPDTVYND